MKSSTTSKAALKKSLQAEQKAVQTRFEKAESLLGSDNKKATPAPPERPKVIRDTFSFPEHDYQLIAQIQARCLQSHVVTNKSEILRAGLKALAGMSDTRLARAVQAVERVKTGRPK